MKFPSLTRSSKHDVAVPAEVGPAVMGPEDETVRLEAELFRKRRSRGRWRRLRPLLIAVLVVAVAAVSVWLVWFSPYLLAEKVSVTGVKVLSVDQVRSRAEVPQVPLASLDVDRIHRRVAALSAVKSVEVTRSWPHTVKIAVLERTPIAVTARGIGYMAMDETGTLFQTFSKRPPRLPLISETAGSNKDARQEAAHVVSSLSPKLLAKVERVEVRSIDGITLVMRSGQQVVWGRASNSEIKAEVLEILIAKPGVRVIDVSVPGRPTTRG